ncbi:DUF7019 family protein [Streptomyces rubradiris]|uniref:DUF7019 family protein n=1 Tax=Streptomyces rubradiris TaxID=285531 RepID=UPI0036EC9AA6
MPGAGCQEGAEPTTERAGPPSHRRGTRVPGARDRGRVRPGAGPLRAAAAPPAPRPGERSRLFRPRHETGYGRTSPAECLNRVCVALVGSVRHLVGHSAAPELGRAGHSWLPSLYRLLRDASRAEPAGVPVARPGDGVLHDVAAGGRPADRTRDVVRVPATTTGPGR